MKCSFYELTMRKLLSFLFLIPLSAVAFICFICFVPGSVAENMHAGVESHLKSLEKKDISVVGRAELATLYTSVILVGRIPFPESADNLFHLFLNQDYGDYALWPGYLVQSYSIRTGIAQVDKSSSLYRKDNLPIEQAYVAQDRRIRHALIWNKTYWHKFEPRIAYLYNPWNTRVENFGLYRRVTVFQWMHFHKGGRTPFPPVALRQVWLNDGLIHNASPNGKLNGFTAYATWLEPALPHSLLLTAALISHSFMRLVLFLSILGTLALMVTISFRSDAIRRSVVSRTLVFIGSIGLGWAILRGLWDVGLGFSQVAAMFDTDSARLFEPYNQKFTNTNTRMKNSPSETIVSPIVWMIWRAFFNYLCYRVCRQIVQLGKNLEAGCTRSSYIKGSICTLFPWVGLPFPTIIIGFSLGIWLLWMTDTSFRVEKT